MSLSRLSKSLKNASKQNIAREIKEKALASAAAQQKVNHFNKQTDAVLQQVMGPYLGLKEFVNLASVNKHFGRLFQQKVTDAGVEKLLSHVVRGEFDDVKAMLQKSPSLLLHKGKAIDYSGRTIDGTAYQMALGAVDTQMAEMIQSYLVKVAGEKEAIAQYQAQFPKGWQETEAKEWAPIFTQLEKLDNAIRTAPANEITNMGNDKLALREDKEATVSVELAKFHDLLDDMAKQPISTGRHFNPRLLLEIFRRYDEYFDPLNLRFDNPKCLLFWQRVIGYVQRFVPVCDAQAIVNGLLNTTTKLKDGQPQNRELAIKVYSYLEGRLVNSSFYPLGDSCLGSDFGISACRAWSRPWWRAACSTRGRAGASGYRILTQIKNRLLTDLAKPILRHNTSCLIS